MKLKNALNWFRRLSVGLTRGERLTYFLIQLLLILVGTILALTHKTLLVAVGAGIIATGAAGLLTFARSVLQEEQSERIRILTRFGILSAFERRGAMIRIQYDERLSGARRGIDVIGFGLKHLQEDYRSSFNQWADACPVRILLIDPEAPMRATDSYASARDGEEGLATGTIAGEVKDFLEKTAHLRVTRPDRFQVRLYHSLPSFNLFRVDDTLFYGPYLLEQQSRNTPTLLLGRGILYDALMSHFEELWSDRHSRAAP